MLPAGLTVTGIGTSKIVVSGTPTASGSVSFTLIPSDSVGSSAGTNYSFTVFPALAISPSSLGNAKVGVRYDPTITVSGGSGSYSSIQIINYRANQTGIDAPEVNTKSGRISFDSKPTRSGTVTFSVKVIDNLGGTLIESFSINVLAASVVLQGVFVG